jgi:hypothetical protein
MASGGLTADAPAAALNDISGMMVSEREMRPLLLTLLLGRPPMRGLALSFAFAVGRRWEGRRGSFWAWRLRGAVRVALRMGYSGPRRRNSDTNEGPVL